MPNEHAGKDYYPVCAVIKKLTFVTSTTCCLQSEKGSKSRTDCFCKAGLYPPPQTTVLLAGSKSGKDDGYGSSATFTLPSAVAASSDGEFVVIAGISPCMERQSVMHSYTVSLLHTTCFGRGHWIHPQDCSQNRRNNNIKSTEQVLQN